MTVNIGKAPVKIYCDGGTHRGLETLVGIDRPNTEIAEFIRRAGWILRGKKVYCPEHAGAK